MREIKFRGKRINNGEWVYGNLVTMDTYGHGYTGTGIQVKNSKTAIYSVQVDPATVGQWTGLTDNHGKEIFEGDIVKYGDNEIAEVVFDDSEFCLRFEDQMFIQHGLLTKHAFRPTEVIDNKWEGVSEK